MSLKIYSSREEMLDIREKFLEAESLRVAGAKTYSLDEVNILLEKLIN